MKLIQISLWRYNYGANPGRLTVPTSGIHFALQVHTLVHSSLRHARSEKNWVEPPKTQNQPSYVTQEFGFGIIH